MSLRAQKAALRRDIRQRLPARRTEQTRLWSLAACETFCRTDAFERATTVMLFLSLPDEVDTSPALERCWQTGKNLLVPRVDWKRHEIDAILIQADSSTSLQRYGLREPSAGDPFDPEAIDLIAVPGLGFDPAGHRLGRGAGFYDRFLPRATNATRCGLAWELQVVDNIPAGDSDAKIDMLATETGLRHFTF